MKCLDLGRVSLDQTITKESDDHHKEKVAGVHKVKINQGAVLLHVQSTPYAQVEKVHEPTIHLKKRVYKYGLPLSLLKHFKSSQNMAQFCYTP